MWSIAATTENTVCWNLNFKTVDFEINSPICVPQGPQIGDFHRHGISRNLSRIHALFGKLKTPKEDFSIECFKS